ncbi:MAG: glycosyltransferase [Crocinitomicaceae bacterium]|nr:glycosyltransferase [Crocinitomicaceae bacterium]
MRQLPLISIIIPTYNAVDSIHNALDSISKQTYDAIEIIVVDYQSTDGTIDLVNKYDDVRVKLIASYERGVYTAMNLGVGQANGSWLYFLGSDDILAHSDVFSSIFKQNIDPAVELLLGKVKNLNRTSQYVPELYQNTFSSMLYWRNTLHHQGVLYHKHVFERFLYNQQFPVLADYSLNIQLFLDGVKAQHSNQLIALSNADGLSKQFSRDLYHEELALKKELLPTWAYRLNQILVKFKIVLKAKKQG